MDQNTVEIKPEPGPVFRWTVLVFISLAMFGNYYIYDSISPLADLLASQLKFTDADIGLLQGIYSIPNIIMLLIGGLMIDRMGTKKSSLIFSILCMIGAFFTVIKGDIYWMATGRLIFGLGAESLIVAITTIIARWFKGKELSFAFGLNLTIARLGSFAALNSPSWAKPLFNNWENPLWLACAAGIISFLSIFIYIILDKAADKKYILQEEGKQDKIKFNDILVFSYIRAIIAALVIISTLIFIPKDLENIMWTTIISSVIFFVKFKFGNSYLYIILLCVTFYSGIFPFMTFSTKFFIEEHFGAIPQDIARSMGGFLTSMLILATMLLTPLFGLFADKKGKRASMMIIGSLMLIPVYLSMNYIHVNSQIPDNVLIKIYPATDKLADICETKNQEIAEQLKSNKSAIDVDNYTAGLTVKANVLVKKAYAEIDSIVNKLNLTNKVSLTIKNDKIIIDNLEQNSVLGTIFNGIAYFFNMIIILFVYFPNLVIPMIIMGISFSLIPAVMWPSVALIVDASKLGTAYGLMTMIQNIGLAGFNLLIGGVNVVSGGYTNGMWIFSTLGFFGLFFAVMLKRNDKTPEGHGLESVKK